MGIELVMITLSISASQTIDYNVHVHVVRQLLPDYMYITYSAGFVLVKNALVLGYL